LKKRKFEQKLEYTLSAFFNPQAFYQHCTFGILIGVNKFISERVAGKQRATAFVLF